MWNTGYFLVPMMNANRRNFTEESFLLPQFQTITSETEAELRTFSTG